MANEEAAPEKRNLGQSALIPVGERGMVLSTLDDTYRFAQFVASSGLAPKEMNTAGILVAIQMGGELGLPPMASIQNIAVINGRPSIWGDAALAVCQMHPDFLDIDEEWDEATQTATCKVYTKKRGMDRPVVRSWSKKDNEAAGLEGGNVHKKFPKRMKQMRARSWALRDTFPGALKGLLTAEEAQEIPPRMVENEAEGAPAGGKMAALVGRMTTPDGMKGVPDAPGDAQAPEATQLPPSAVKPSPAPTTAPDEPEYEPEQEPQHEDPPFDIYPETQDREPGCDDDRDGSPDEDAPAAPEQIENIKALKAKKGVSARAFASIMVDAGSVDAQVVNLTAAQAVEVIHALEKLKS